MIIEVGTPVKIIKGTHRGKKGKVIKKRPLNSLQKGKIPVQFGSRNHLVWVRPNWLETVEDRENFSKNESDYMGKNREKVQEEKCQQQLQQSDCLKESVVSVEQQSLSEDLTGSNQLKSTTTRSQSSEKISTTTSGTETSETTFPSQEQQIYSLVHSPVPEQVMLESEPDLNTPNQPFGEKHSDASSKESHSSLSWNNLKDLSTEDFERSLAACEWQDILGTIRKSSTQRKSELFSTGVEFLSSPTLTASSGVKSRPAGRTRCEDWLKKKGALLENQVLSVAGMALLSGFPPNWTDCLLEQNPSRRSTGLEAGTSTAEPLSPNKQSSPLKESSISTPLLPGTQWIDPKIILLKEGTQPRDCDENFAGEMSKIQQYADDMRSGLWDFEKVPLPVAFVDSAGKIHAADCHHRVSAAIASGQEKIKIDLRKGELLDAQLYAITANTDHGLPLRPRDQRKRVEMLLDLLETIDEKRASKLLDSIPNLGKLQRTNSSKEIGKWTARTVAKYLRLNESGYRTVQNIMLERRRIKEFTGFKIDNFTRVIGSKYRWEGRIHSFDQRKGVFVIPLPWSIGNEGRMLDSQWVEPWELEKISQSDADKIAAAVERSNRREKSETVFTSVKEEQKHQAKELGIAGGLPDVERNEGDPTALDNSIGVSVTAESGEKAITRLLPTANSLLPVVEQLNERELIKLWDAIAPKVSQIKERGLCA